MTLSRKNNVNNLITKYSSSFDYKNKETAIILAAGHGKRIKSQTSKMLHKIWEKPTVQRVFEACKKGLPKSNSIIVTGIKAEDVIQVIGEKRNNIFAFQEEQNGTGHAVQIALQKISKKKYNGIVYILPGDMGLIDENTMKMFRKEFIKSKSDMMVLTGIYSGNPDENSYGRIVRVKDVDDKGKSSGKNAGKVIEIIEHKDILNLDDKKPLVRNINGQTYSFTKKELINNNEFNSGVFAFKYEYLVKLINKIKSDNVQGEIYITDLIALFNKNNLSVGAISAKQQHVIMGFNNKSVLKEMDAIARKLAYEQIKDIIAIDDPDDFFIAEDVIEEIVKQDKKGTPLDIKIGKGVHVGEGVKLNYNIKLRKNVYVEGNVYLGKNVIIGENVHLSCFPNQKLEIGDNVEILWGDIIKGNLVIGENSRIESSVNITGSDEYPTRIGKNVIIKGTSYVFGSVIDDDLFVEHSVLIKKKVDKLIRKDGKVQDIKFFLPMPEGIDAIEDL
ncbi:MAG: NTP transferase domain-containing protein [Ignavibacteriales bacterium]|nr:NTP transferase domain-containing protein [Ignavibacteriales bacterium]MCB9209288.1 NTP transferase domain-containing protein [Ignavibacteriales bacterium]MCB9257932.1 NTP transferase domain-containing protein [Ignavibacteriales bacterium]